MPQEVKELLVGTGMILTVVGASLALIAVGGTGWWNVTSTPLVTTLALFLPAEWPEDADA